MRDLPQNLPAQTPIEVRFRYHENGRLAIQVNVQGTENQLTHEIMRENSLTQDQLDSWRLYISGLPPVAAIAAPKGAGPEISETQSWLPDPQGGLRPS